MCVCVYEKERETDGLLMLRRGSLSQRVLLWALEAKEEKRREEKHSKRNVSIMALLQPCIPHLA